MTDLRMYWTHLEGTLEPHVPPPTVMEAFKGPLDQHV